MRAIYKRELKGYLTSMVGYVFLFLILLLVGVYVTAYNIAASYPMLEAALSSSTFVFLIAVPLLTMRVLAEERRQKTDQLLLTAPVKIREIVLGKYLALVTVFLIPMGILCLYPLVLGSHGTVNYPAAYVAILGFFLLGCGEMAVGVFLSSVTESQVVAAVLTFLTLFISYMIAGISSFIPQTAAASLFLLAALILLLTLAVQWVLKKTVVSVIFGLLGEGVLLGIYFWKSEYFEGLMQKILGAFDLSGHFAPFTNGLLDFSGVVYYLTIVVIFLFLTMETMQKRRWNTFRHRSYSLANMALAAAVVVAANLVAGELPVKYREIDVSEQKLYTITKETEEFLAGLDQEVEIYRLVQQGNEDPTVSRMLALYEDASKQISVQDKDPVIHPNFASEYTEEELSENSLIVVSGERVKTVPYQEMYETQMNYYSYSYDTTAFDGEGQITGAISYVTSETMPVLYTLEGHGERTPEGSFAQAIEKANMELKSIDLVTRERVPKDAACLMILSPAKDITSEEKERILAYLEQGGKGIFFSDYTQEEMPNYHSLWESYGVTLEEGLVIEGDSRRYAAQMPYYLVPQMESHPWTSQAVSDGMLVMTPMAQGITELSGHRDTLTVEPLLSTSDQAYAKANLQAETLEKEAQDAQGPFWVGAAVTEELENGETTEIACFSTSTLIDDQVNQMVAGGNQQFFMGLVNSLCQNEEYTAVSVPSKSLQTAALTWTDDTASFWKICIIGVIPAVFLLCGFCVWMQRRKR